MRAPALRLHLRMRATASMGASSGDGDAPCASSSSSSWRKRIVEPGGRSNIQDVRISRMSPLSSTATRRSSSVESTSSGELGAEAPLSFSAGRAEVLSPGAAVLEPQPICAKCQRQRAKSKARKPQRPSATSL